MHRQKSKNSKLIHWLKFNLIGIIGVIVQLSLLKIFTSWLSLNYLIATVLAVELTMLHNFYWHDRWTWQDRPRTRARETFYRLLRFNLTNGAISLVGNLILMKLLVGWFHVPMQLANLISIGVCSLFNFLIADLYVFRKLTETLSQEVNVTPVKT